MFEGKLFWGKLNILSIWEGAANEIPANPIFVGDSQKYSTRTFIFLHVCIDLVCQNWALWVMLQHAQ